jgi:hypothetical protein
VAWYLVSGSPTPDCTGTYSIAGTANGQPYATDGSYVIWYDGGSWWIAAGTTPPGTPPMFDFWWRASGGLAGAYAAVASYTGDVTLAVGVDRYWVASSAGYWGDDHWAFASGGAADGFGPPTDDGVAYFDGNGLGNCTLTDDIFIKGLNQSTAYTGQISDGGYTVSLGSSGVVIANASGRLASTGAWKLTANTSTLSNVYYSNNAFAIFELAAGVSATQSGHVHCRKLVVGAGSTLATSGSYSLRLADNATLTNPLDINATGNVTGRILLYMQTSQTHSQQAFAISSTLEVIVMPATLQATGNFTVANNLIIYGGSGTAESQAGVLDMQTHDLSVAGLIILGISTTAERPGKVLFGSGAHTIGGLYARYVDADPMGFVDFGTCDLTVNKSVNFDLRGCQTSNAATATLTFSGTSDQDVYSDGETLPAVEIDKTAGVVTLMDDATTASLTGTDGTLDTNGQDLTVSGAIDLAAGFAITDPVGSTWTCDTFTADGNTLTATGAWYLDAATSAVASGTGTVSYCDASGGVPVHASAGPWTDGGNNANWLFASRTASGAGVGSNASGSGTGTVIVSGTGTAVGGAAVGSGGGEVLVQGSGIGVGSNAIGSGTGTVQWSEITGSGVGIGSPATGSGSGRVLVAGSGTGEGGLGAGSGTGTVLVSCSGAAVGENAVGSGQGAVTPLALGSVFNSRVFHSPVFGTSM